MPVEWPQGLAGGCAGGGARLAQRSIPLVFLAMLVFASLAWDAAVFKMGTAPTPLEAAPDSGGIDDHVANKPCRLRLEASTAAAAAAATDLSRAIQDLQLQQLELLQKPLPQAKPLDCRLPPSVLFIEDVHPDSLSLPEGTGEGQPGGEGHTVALLARNMTAVEAGKVVDDVLQRYPSYLVQSEPAPEDALVLFVLREHTSPVTAVWRQLRDLHSPRDPDTCAAATESHRRFKGWNNGWGSDLSQALGAAAHSLKTNTTACMYPWYVDYPAGNREVTFEPGQYFMFAYNTCDLRSQDCYFISPFNTTCCQQYKLFEDAPFETGEDLDWGGDAVDAIIQRDFAGNRDWYNAAMTGYVWRHRYWLRQALRQSVAQWPHAQQRSTPHAQQRSTPCAALHVRRSDVKLETGQRAPAGFHHVSEYLLRGRAMLEALGIRRIVLLTDSADAVVEAQEVGDYEWEWLDKARYADDSDNIQFSFPFPSGDPTLETLQLLTELEVVKQCSMLITDEGGNFAHLLYTSMCGRDADSWSCPPWIRLNHWSHDQDPNECTDKWDSYKACSYKRRLLGHIDEPSSDEAVYAWQ